jgi:hypothetical protein
MVVSAVNTSVISCLQKARHPATLRLRSRDGLDELHIASGTKPAEEAASVRSYVERWAPEVLGRRHPSMTLEVPNQVRLVEPSQLRRLVRPSDRAVDVDDLQQPAHSQNAGERAWAETDLFAELLYRSPRLVWLLIRRRTLL